MELDVKSPEGVLRLGYGLVPLVAGADKFTNLLVDWEQYLSPLARKVIPLKPRSFMKLVGVIEMGVGLAVLTRWRKEGSYVAAGWLAAIAANLLACGKYFDIAARDALLAIGALAHARLERPWRARIPELASPREELPTSGLQVPAVRSPEIEHPALY